jgi:hypothetical protein
MKSLRLAPSSPIALLAALALLALAPMAAAQMTEEPEVRRVSAPLTVEQGMFVENGGLVGVGTSNPQVPLHVNSSTSSVIRMQNAGGVRLEFRDDANNVQWDFRTTSGNTFTIARLTPSPANMMSVLSNGDLRIAGSLLTQNGANTYPDFVFEDEYPLMPLADLAAYISDHRHLPDVQSQAEVSAAGVIDMSKLQLQLLRKIEELTLYTIEQQQLIEALQARLAAIEASSATGEAAAR